MRSININKYLLFIFSSYLFNEVSSIVLLTLFFIISYIACLLLICIYDNNIIFYVKFFKYQFFTAIQILQKIDIWSVLLEYFIKYVYIYNEF